jgi:hypothetical protein
MSDASDMSDVTATATNKGDISVLITGADGKRVQAEISIQFGRKTERADRSGACYSPHSGKPAIAPASYLISGTLAVQVQTEGAVAIVTMSVLCPM